MPFPSSSASPPLPSLRLLLLASWICCLFTSVTGDGNHYDDLFHNLHQLNAAKSVTIHQSKARVVVPNLDHFPSKDVPDAASNMEKDLLSSATSLWNERGDDHPDGLFALADGSQPQPSAITDDTANSLRLHLETGQSRLLHTHGDHLKFHCKKTGTTIAGCTVNTPQGPYVLLAADTRATDQTMVADKTCSKIHPLASNCWCCGAGTSGDLDKVTRKVLYNMALKELRSSSVGNGDVVDRDEQITTNKVDKSAVFPLSQILYQQQYCGDATDMDLPGAEEPLIHMMPVSIPVLCQLLQDQLFQAEGQLGVNLILGGVWQGQPYLRAIHPHGSMDVGLPFAALGSGGLAAMAVLEEGYCGTLTLEEGIDLVQRAILSGIRNDLGSGSQVDLCIISPDGSSRHTRCAVPEEVLDDRDSERSSSSSSSSQAIGEEKGRRSASPSFGVNGFGNSPFRIESTRQRVFSIEADQAREKTLWNSVLGL
jgi:20S proteasome subunit beta 2